MFRPDFVVDCIDDIEGPTTSSQVQFKNYRRYQSHSYKRASDIDDRQVSSPAHKTSKQEGNNPNSIHEDRCRPTNDDDCASSAATQSNARSCIRHTIAPRDISPFQLNMSHSHTDAAAAAAAAEEEDEDEGEDASLNSLLDANTNTIRFRSVSFCTGIPSSNRSGLSKHTPPLPGVPNFSILESILLNRNIPAFYSGLRPIGTDSSNSSSSEDPLRPSDGVHKYPPLSTTAIPTNDIRRRYSDQESSNVPRWMLGREEESVCLSFKKRKVSLDSSYRPTTSERDVTSTGSEDKTNASDIRSSILHSLLTKKYSNADQRRTLRSEEQSDDAHCISSSSAEPEDTRSVTMQNPMSHVDSTESLQTLEMLALADKSRQVSFRHQRVVIAKKMQLVVSRKVRKWLTEMVQLAARYRDLTNLPRDDWIILLRNALSRLLLLFMAESNFQFAVAPIPTEMLKANDAEDTSTVVPAEIPTNQSVEDIQRFIAKCQALKVDGKEYHCMRLITLFHSGCGHGLQHMALVEQLNSGACKILQELVRLSHPDEKLRYGELLLHLRSLASVNSRMVQRLFCNTREERDGNYARIDESEWLF